MGDHLHVGHGHSHGPSREADQRWLLAALLLLAAYLVGEVTVAAIVGSLALLADAGHMLTDVGALAGALWAARLAVRPARGRWTFGWQRAEILSAALNGITLLVVAGVVLTEAVRRLLEHPHVPGLPVLATALVGCVVNVAAVALMARADRRGLNVEGAYRHVLTDLVGFAATAVAGVVILATGWSRADAVASLVLVVLLVLASWGLLHESGLVLLETAPREVDVDEVRRHLLEAEHILDVHDLHVWTVTSGLPTISVHLIVDDGCFVDGRAPQLLDHVQDCLHGHFDVEHSTFQLEPASHAAHEPGTH